MSEPKEIGATPGLVKDEYVDNVMLALEREADLIPERQEVFEGRELSREEETLFRQFAEQIRLELDRRACPLGFRVPRVDPENMGKGFRFFWTRYTQGEATRLGHVDYHYDDVLRFMRDGDSSVKFGEAVGRKIIDGILKSLLSAVPS